MTPTLGDEERGYLESLEAGDMPLAVYADWLEENGDDRAAGARWLVDWGAEPRRMAIGWWWPPLRSSVSGLPLAVRRGMPRYSEPFPTFADALWSAVYGATDVVAAGGLDKHAEVVRIHRDENDPRAYVLWLESRSDPLAEGAAWIETTSARPHRESEGWTWSADESRLGRESWLRAEVYDRLDGGEFLPDPPRRAYDDFELAVNAAAAAIVAWLATLPPDERDTAWNEPSAR